MTTSPPKSIRERLDLDGDGWRFLSQDAPNLVRWLSVGDRVRITFRSLRSEFYSEGRVVPGLHNGPELRIDDEGGLKRAVVEVAIEYDDVTHVVEIGDEAPLGESFAPRSRVFAWGIPIRTVEVYLGDE